MGLPPQWRRRWLGEVINGGFGMVIDGSIDADEKIQSMLDWDVNNGVARRAWARNEGAEFAIKRAMSEDSRLKSQFQTM